MKTLIMSATILLASSAIASAQSQYGNQYGTGSNPNSHATQGYSTNHGTYVAPHYQTNPNSTTLDNYGTRGNYNPNNGRTGTRSPY